ncbi:MAG: nitroreductase family protein [Proteobacteria bacterium]|nr:nitroreductase family protein [Pseudomonadota bacterium]
MAEKTARKKAPEAAAPELSPLGTYQEGMEFNPVEKVIFERRSIRMFKKEPLPDSMIRRILEAGRFAPSAGNAQPWKFAVIKSPEILAELEEDARKMSKLFMKGLDYTRGPVRRAIMGPGTRALIRLMKNTLHPVPFSLLKVIAEDKAPVFHGAPTLVLLYQDDRGVSRPAVDIGICGQNMVLAAHSLGAASCWLGMIKLPLYLPKWRKRLGVAYPYRLDECLALGWPSQPADGAVPREIQEVTWFEGGPDDPPRVERQGS